MNHDRLERLRDRLLGQGSPTIAPPGPSGTPARQKPQPPEQRAMYERIRPFAEAVYLVVSADREIGQTERNVLRGALRILTDGALSSSAMESMLAEFDAALARDGFEQRLDDVAAEIYGDMGDQELALSLAAAAATADGRLDAQERAALEGFAERFGLPRQRLEQLLG